jgi:hypothetical protein
MLIGRQYRWLFRRSIVVDGNFHADHLKMRNPEDVALADGCAFMVETKPYMQHLLDSKEGKQVSIGNVFPFFRRRKQLGSEIRMS